MGLGGHQPSLDPPQTKEPPLSPPPFFRTKNEKEGEEEERKGEEEETQPLDLFLEPPLPVMVHW